MIELYCKLIRCGRKTFDDVPDELKSRVEERLEELGYDTNGTYINNDI